MTAKFSQLPLEIVHHILNYDGRITYRNGKFMNKIPNPDENYPLVLERMRFQQHRRFCDGYSFVTMKIRGLTTEKTLIYWATNAGLKITFFEWNYHDNRDFIREEMLFCNR
jgi:hypothetical protein